MNEALVSVVLPTYNTAQYVGESIRSVLDQTYRQLELIVIDDGSTDDTRELVREFESDKRFRYMHQENRGEASTRNRGIQLARGEFVASADADDIWYPHKLERQIPLFYGSNRVGLVYSERDWIDAEGNSISGYRPRRYRGAGLCDLLFLTNFVPHSSCVVRREAFEKTGLYDEALQRSPDWDLWLRFAVHYAFDFVSEPLCAKRKWPGQISRDLERVAAAQFTIMTRFLRNYPNAVSRGAQRKAFAKAHILQAEALLARGKRLSAFGSLLRALRRDPISSRTAKSLAKLVLGRDELF